MQILVAFIALPAVALLLALASRLEDGLRAAARPGRGPLALPPGPTAVPAVGLPLLWWRDRDWAPLVIGAGLTWTALVLALGLVRRRPAPTHASAPPVAA